MHDQLTKSISTVAEQVRVCNSNVEELLSALGHIERGPGREEAYPGPRVKEDVPVELEEARAFFDKR